MRLASLFALALILVAALSPVARAQSVLISELADPRLNYQTDRFIEIYNAGGSAVNLAGWKIVAVGNGADIFTWNLTGTIQPGEALVAGNQTLTVSFPVDFADDGWAAANGTWNGKIGDGAKLVNASSAVVDYIVADNTRFENMDYVRNANVTAPSTTYNPAEWTGTAIDYPTDGTPGSHGTAGSVPEIANIQISPTGPQAGQTVTVTADLTDALATITSAEVRWGTSPVSLSNTIAMTPQSGNTWITVTAIPGQTSGTTVYFEIEAFSDAPASTVSGQQSYIVSQVVPIQAVQGAAGSSPYNGASLRTSGVVTAAYAGMYVIQDGTGPWSGLWVSGTPVPAVGDSVEVQGTVTENLNATFAGTTVLASATVEASASAVVVPAAATLTASAAFAEGYEGVLVRVANAQCTNVDLGGGVWQLNDGSASGRVAEFGYDGTPTLGTRYDVTGPLAHTGAVFALEPRAAGDIAWVGDTFAPLILDTTAESLTTVRVTFTEALGAASAQTAGNYAVSGTSVLGAALAGGNPAQVVLTTAGMTSGSHTLTVNGVQDLYGNGVAGAFDTFDVSLYSPPAGYYASAEGLTGETLRGALHAIIDNHTVKSYDFALTAFQTTDDKPNGKVWDMYSDVPGGTPPYEYTFGVDEGASASGEGQGYNREHSWPRSWFGGAVSPMNSDLFQLYPTDIYVNSIRGNLPYGEVSSPDYVSQNGTKRGPNTWPGYTGTVLEPIDAYKGDFARSYFYMTVRYYTEDGSWPGSDMVDGCTLKPWAQEMLIAWNQQDPVSDKERERNQTIYGFQGNRNPFIDRPDFVAKMFNVATGVPDEEPHVLHLLANMPNPFTASTTILFDLEEPADRVTVEVFDLRGRRIRSLFSGAESAGEHHVTWDGTGDDALAAPAGIYFYRVATPEGAETRKMLLLR